MFSWILAALRDNGPELRVLYTLDGGVPDEQRELAVRGYRDSRPVRAGNRAAAQLQLGNFGDLFDTVARYVAAGHLLDLGRLGRSPIWRTNAVIAGRRRTPESGSSNRSSITPSPRSGLVALDWAAALASTGQLPGERAQRWASEAAEVRRWVNERCWSDERQTYTMYAGSSELDAAVPLAGRTGFDRGSACSARSRLCSANLGSATARSSSATGGCRMKKGPSWPVRSGWCTRWRVRTK